MQTERKLNYSVDYSHCEHFEAHMLTEVKTITQCINMITYHDGGFWRVNQRGFRDIVLEVIQTIS